MEICGNGIKVAAGQESQRTRSRRKVHTRRLGTVAMARKQHARFG